MASLYRRYQSESSFVDDFLKYITHNSIPLNGDSLRPTVAVELPLPNSGIADIVLINPTIARKRCLNKGLLERISKSRSFASYFSVYGESWASNCDDVARRLAISTSTASNYSGFLSQFHRSTIQMHRRALSKMEIWTIEAKLRNWKRAVRQASKYTLCSSGSIILMPRQNIGPVLSHVRALRSLGIGLWSYCPDEMTLERHCAPRKRLPLISSLKYQTASRIWLQKFKRSIV